MRDVLATRTSYRSLSMKDLLDARELYHYHLMNKPNVVGTAIGLYLIRKTDPWPSADVPEQQLRMRREGRAKKERRFDNSEVREYSWPCVLALVKDWVKEEEFGGSGGVLHPDEMVPRTLYLPDGRTVPVCVVRVTQAPPSPALLPDWRWPKGLYGAGMPILVDAQGVERRATVGCLVSDGHAVYAVTSRHVAGQPGEVVYTLSGGRRVPVGRASARQLTRLAFEDVYGAYPGQHTYVNADVGLVELDDVNRWTSQTFGLGDCGERADLNELSLSTRLIGAPVVAMGAATGRLEGQIKALFYRYRSVGGYDYVADFLIGPPEQREEGPSDVPSEWPQTRGGDSGAVWHLVVPPEPSRPQGARGKKLEKATAAPAAPVYRPLAVQWGGQTLAGNGTRADFTFALATSLTTVCRSLDVELVLGHEVGVVPYWGASGHYTIGARACGLVRSARLEQLMQANVDRVSFAAGSLDAKAIANALKEAREGGGFVPLADVPDMVWKRHYTKVRGGRDTQYAGGGRTTGPEHPTHFADIDEVRPSDGKTLRELSLKADTNLTVEAWQAFYAELGHTESRERGLLPFRVWQFFDEMRRAAKAKDVARFVCAAGILAHYVGDACQPLHGSVLADGYKDRPMTTTHTDRETGEAYTKESNVGAGVHSTYETKMVDRYLPQLLDLLEGQTPRGATRPVKTGQDAARATVELMDVAARRIPPHELVDTYVEAGGTATAQARDALWEAFGEATASVVAEGALVLAQLWDAAWAAGGGDSIAKTKLVAIPTDALQALYEDPKFVESLDLDHISSALEPAP